MINTEKFLQGGGKMGELIRQMDWAQTTLGKPVSWPESLKSALSISLNSSFPIAIYWGADFTLFYNDAWSSILGDKHPWALGKPGAVVLPEIWDGLDAQLKKVLTNGQSVHSENALLPINRSGYLEECYFDYTLSPIIASDGSVGGVFNTVIETSYRVINERRNKLLYALSQLNSLESFADGVKSAMKILETGKADLPFSLLYLAPENAADVVTLTAASGIALNDAAAIEWPFEQVFTFGKVVQVSNLSDYTKIPVEGCALPGCTEALLMPLSINDTKTRGCLVAGISSSKRLDADYQNFISSVATNVGTAISKGCAYQQEQKHKQRISESENRFRSMIDQAPVAMAVFRGENLQISKANKAMLQMVGRTEEVIGQHLLKAIPEITNQPILAILKEVYQTGKPYNDYNLPVTLLRNGHIEIAYFDFSCSPLVEDGQITGVLEVASEVTERFKVQEKLQENEALFRGITAAAPITLWVTDEKGNVTYVNETWIKWTGKPLENHLGKGWMDAVSAEDKAQVYDKFFANFTARRYHENTFNIITANGGELSLNCTGNPIFDDHHQFKGYVGACVDITEQKQLQQQKDNFLGIASHELKTPVTSIKAYAQVLEMMFRRDGDTKKADMLGKLDKQVNRLSSLIGDLLDVTKIHTGRLQFNETEFDFNALVTEVIEDVQHTSLKHQIKKELRFAGSICGDTERISQVITNLLTNAIKYSPDANEIIIYTKETDGQVQLCVQDFGIGISAHKKDLVFEQFYRVSGSKEHTFPGLGLGLYISSEIIKRLNGRIWVTSVEGKGSTFCFSLPLRKSAQNNK